MTKVTKAKEERDLQLINVMYFKPREETNWEDQIMIVYKDEDGNKKFQIKENPDFEYYVNKDDHWTNQPVSYIEPDQVELVSTPYKDLFKHMAYQLGDEAMQFWKECKASGKRYYMNRLHLNANVHQSDVDISDYYIAKFLDQYPDRGRGLSKAYFDIEVDIINHEGFPDEHEAPCPINIVTMRMKAINTCLVYILRNENNPLVGEFEDNIEAESKWIHDYVLEKEGMDSEFVFKFFTNEIDLIKEFFDDVNLYRPDYNGAWNMGFDVQTFINRIRNLGYDPEKIICPKEMPYKMVYYREDTRNQDPADNGSYFMVSSYTNWIDLMYSYASLRKTAGKEDSYSLDAISQKELKKRKLQFGEGETIKTLPYMDFRKFALYNIIDVIRLEQLEDKNEDVSMLHTLGMLTRTRVNKALAKTVCLKNLARKFYLDQGYIMSNNHNATYGGDREETGKFRGAYVADPLLNHPLGKLINGKLSKFIYENVIDMDLSSLYPSIILALNIDSSTQYGKLMLENPNWDPNDPNSMENLSPNFFDSLTSKDWIRFGHNWFDLPLPEELLLEEFPMEEPA